MIPELEAMKRCWQKLDPLSKHERARVLLWMTRKHQNSGGPIDLRALEAEAVEPPREEENGET